MGNKHVNPIVCKQGQEKTYSKHINISLMAQDNDSHRSFSGMLMKANLLVVCLAEVPRLCITSSWNGWLPTRPFGWPFRCLDHLVPEDEESCYSDSNRKGERKISSLVQKHCFLTLGNLVPLQFAPTTTLD